MLCLCLLTLVRANKGQVLSQDALSKTLVRLTASLFEHHPFSILFYYNVYQIYTTYVQRHFLLHLGCL